MHSLILAAVMVTNHFIAPSWQSSWENSAHRLSPATDEPVMTYISGNNKVDIGSAGTNIVIHTELKPLVTHSNGLYWIRFSKEKQPASLENRDVYDKDGKLDYLTTDKDGFVILKDRRKQ